MSKLGRNRSGFGTIEAFLVVIIIGMVSFVGWYVWHAQKSADTTLAPLSSKSPTFKEQQKTNISTNATQTNEAEYLVIPQWNIKVKLGAADPSILTYTLSTVPSNGLTGQLTSVAALSLKSSVTTDANCQSLGIEIDQGLVSAYEGNGTPPNTVGSYYYQVTGSPYACDNASMNTIRENYLGNYPSTWTYLAGS